MPQPAVHTPRRRTADLATTMGRGASQLDPSDRLPPSSAHSRRYSGQPARPRERGWRTHRSKRTTSLLITEIRCSCCRDLRCARFPAQFRHALVLDEDFEEVDQRGLREAPSRLRRRPPRSGADRFPLLLRTPFERTRGPHDRAWLKSNK